MNTIPDPGPYSQRWSEQEMKKRLVHFSELLVTKEKKFHGIIIWRKCYKTFLVLSYKRAKFARQLEAG